jgi:5'-nucleotidase / UDP-sugar diphosphatase
MNRLLAILAITLFVRIAPVPGAVREVTILHINDMHARLLPSDRGAGGFAQLAAAIRRERENCGSCLLLHAGDVVQGTPVSTIFRGLPVYEISNLFGFDAGTVGNHEFDYGWQMTRKFLKIARYPVVSANIVDENGRLMANKPYVILKTNGVRVGVIGALTVELPRVTTPKTRGPWRALPVVEAVRRYLAEVQRKSDLVVLLAHITTAEEQEVMASLPEIPVAITGHDHRGLSAAAERSGRIVVRVKGYTEELGRLDLRVDTDRNKVVSWSWKRIPISGSGPVAADVDQQVKRWEGEVTKVVDTPIGESRRRLKRADLKPLIERAMAAEMQTDFAFVNNGGLRDELPEGRVLARHIWNIMPFDNIVVVAKVRGSELPAVIAQGRQIDPGRIYTLATTDFSADNQGTPGSLGTTGLTFTTEGPLLRDVLIEWIRKQKVVGTDGQTP